MNDLLIKVSKRSRLIDLDHSTLGIVGENLQEKLIFTFQDEFVDGMARLEYELDTQKHYVLMEKVGQSYILPVQNVLLTKEGNIDLQLVITEDKTGTPVFKSEVFTLYCKKSIEAVGEADRCVKIVDAYLKGEAFNTQMPYISKRNEDRVDLSDQVKASRITHLPS